MKRFIQRRAEVVTGVLGSFDWLPFRGTLRWLASRNGLELWLHSVGIKLREFTAGVNLLAFADFPSPFSIAT